MPAQDLTDRAARARLQTTLAGLPALAKAIGEGAASREARRELPYDGFALFRQSGLGRLRLPVEKKDRTKSHMRLNIVGLKAERRLE